MNSRTPINPAVAFLQTPQLVPPRELVQRYALYVLESADGYRLPVPLDYIRERFSMAVHKQPLDPAQRGFTTGDLRIYLNADDLPTVRSFTFAHEVMELLFLAVREGAADDWMSDETFVALQHDKERLCESGAAGLLLPMPLFADLVSQQPFSLAWARRIAGRCAVSLTATIWRILELGLANALFVVWRFSHSSAQFVPSAVGQTNFFGSPEVMDPPRKMRVERVLAPVGFGEFVPKQKSVAEGTAVHRAYVNGVAEEGRDELELGELRGTYFVEAAPFWTDSERRVMSLIHLNR